MGKPIKAIIVDDEPGAIANLSLLLPAYPRIEVAATVTNALLAVDLIHEHQPDVVFLDIQMPEKTGFEIAKELLEAGNSPADWNYSELFFGVGKSELATMNIGSLEESLPKNDFFRISRSLIINVNYLTKVNRKKRLAQLIKDGQEYNFPIPLLNIHKLERFLS